MYFRCQHCDQPFESTEARPRCPRCLRITTVVPLGAPAAPPAASRRGPAAPQREAPAAHRALQPAGRGSPPWPLWLGVALMASSGMAALFTDFGAAPAGERLGMAIGYAALGGAGLALAVRGFVSWRR
jgi:hypothetical protein